MFLVNIERFGKLFPTCSTPQALTDQLLLLAVKNVTDRGAEGQCGKHFPEVRVHRPASSHTLEALTTRVEWGAEPACDPRARGVMLGYHPAGVEQFAAGVAAGVEGS
ncbi:hypothetical protein [Streptomyces sp. NPDC049906]|uniref:hypothetical protein n=1 Tax=Streptomyces sp. NPDC049906 TaxID=3155656 RepID=UPI0034319F47